MQKTLIISTADIRKVIRKKGLDKFMPQLICEIEKSFIDFQEGRIIVLPRGGFYFNKGLIEIMPAYGDNLICIKIGSVYKNNRKLGLPTTSASIMLFDKMNGYPLAFIEDTLLTALRTGAASAVATKYLARKNSSAIGIIGAGTQAYCQLYAISLVMPYLKDVYVHDKNTVRIRDFIKNNEKLKINSSKLKFHNSKNIKELCMVSDIIVTSTNKRNSEPPLIKKEWIRPGTHINAIGTDVPKKGFTEIDKKLLERSKIIVDFLKQAIKEGESQNIREKNIYAELGEILIKSKAGRKDANEITIFDSTGVAFQDMKTVQLLMRYYRGNASGFYTPKDIVNPYQF